MSEDLIYRIRGTQPGYIERLSRTRKFYLDLECLIKGYLADMPEDTPGLSQFRDPLKIYGYRLEHLADILDVYTNGLRAPFRVQGYGTYPSKTYATVTELDQAALAHGTILYGHTSQRRLIQGVILKDVGWHPVDSTACLNIPIEMFERRPTCQP